MAFLTFLVCVDIVPFVQLNRHDNRYTDDEGRRFFNNHGGHHPRKARLSPASGIDVTSSRTSIHFMFSSRDSSTIFNTSNIKNLTTNHNRICSRATKYPFHAHFLLLNSKALQAGITCLIRRIMYSRYRIWFPINLSVIKHHGGRCYFRSDAPRD